MNDTMDYARKTQIVNEVEATHAVRNDLFVNDSNRRKKNESRKEPRERRKPKDYFHTIAKAVERSNDILIERKSPFRFCIYLKKESVFIDLVELDSAGKVKSAVRKNITQEDFDRLIEDVSQIEGLLFDGIA